MSKSLIQSLLITSLCASLAACGGGGGGSSESAPIGTASASVAPANDTSTPTTTASSQDNVDELAFTSDPNAPVGTVDPAIDLPFDPELNPIPNDPNEVAEDGTAISLATSAGGTMRAAALSGAACEGLPAMPSVPSGARSVREFGAIPNDNIDDTAAIQRALNSLQPGQWLRFPAGRYIHNKSLWMHVPGSVMWSDGATLHATNKTDQGIMLAADGASIYGFTLTAVSDVRRTTPWESRIAIFDDVRNTAPTRNNVIRRNKILAGTPGTSTANGASAAGIYVYFAENFLIAENEIHRTLSDGMHITRASAYGRVLNNKIRETGDDMIGMVSLLGDNWTKTSAQVEVNSFSERARRNVVHDIVVAGNDLAGQYWGRGISVVGGRGITIRDNKINRPTQAAAIYLAREPGYMTFGVHNIVVKNNYISEVQTTNPVYSVKGIPAKSNQAGIEMYANIFDDESRYSLLRSELRVARVHVENNTVDRTKNNGLRTGVTAGKRNKIVGRTSEGAYIERWYTGVNVGPVNLANNKFTNIGSAPAMRLMNSITGNPATYCSNNLMSGLLTGSSLCNTSSTTAVTGARLTCG
ncbi:MAG TPA: right-handed parallel beta-helix repeat-containing protein [Burkholderiaceae bacterium]|nr:right-handed parallel beta-helix repeat-containing protein [Burkholderiaceae bacterium]